MTDETPRFTVFGCWPTTKERFAWVFTAPDARTAERLMKEKAATEGGQFWVAGIVAGAVEVVDLYTAYVDVDDPANQDIGDLELDVAGDLRTFTVLGIARDPSDRRAYEEVIGERYADTVPATSPGAAEDVARGRLADKGGELWVCAVIEGEVRRADVYATFVDPDRRAVA